MSNPAMKRVLAGITLGLTVFLGAVLFARGAEAQNPSFNLVNRGGSAIRELYLTPAGKENWGQNWLAGRTTIAPGASYPVRRQVDGNCIFDIRVVYADGHIEDQRLVNTCKAEDIVFGAKAAAPKAADDPSFRLMNRGSQAIDALYVRRAGSAEWGANRLQDPLVPRSGQIIHLPRGEGCGFDLRVVLADHHALEKTHADLCRITDLPVP
jgi:hypothetical protein